MVNRRQFLQAGQALTAAQAVGRSATEKTIQLTLQTRDRSNRLRSSVQFVDPKKIAVMAIDCWHYHWCRTWRNRAGSLMPRFNYSFDAARELGMTFIFSPTNAMRDLVEADPRPDVLPPESGGV